MSSHGVHLSRSDEFSDEITALTDVVGVPVGLDALLDDLKFDLRRARVTPKVLGRAVHRAWAWNAHDRVDPEWYPQGVAGAHDAPGHSVVPEYRRIMMTSWYSKGLDGTKRGSRLSFLDLDTRRYRHVLLVQPRLGKDGRLTLSPMKVHAGGIVWAGKWVHVAATAKGFVSAHLDDLIRVPGSDGARDEFGLRERGIASFGHRYVLPVRRIHTAHADDTEQRLRYSFISLDAASSPPGLVAGEYALNPDTSTRLARFDLEPGTLELDAPDGVSRPVRVGDAGVLRMQGAVRAGGRLHVSVSNGSKGLGTMWTGELGALRRHRWAMPMGPEDLTYSPADDHLWTVTEHPRRRWLISMRRSWFD